jgi:hypothetical protein
MSKKQRIHSAKCARSGAPRRLGRRPALNGMPDGRPCKPPRHQRAIHPKIAACSTSPQPRRSRASSANRGDTQLPESISIASCAGSIIIRCRQVHAGEVVRTERIEGETRREGIAIAILRAANDNRRSG